MNLQKAVCVGYSVWEILTCQPSVFTYSTTAFIPKKAGFYPAKREDQKFFCRIPEQFIQRFMCAPGGSLIRFVTLPRTILDLANFTIRRP